MTQKQVPSSRNIWNGESKDYWITAVEWNSFYGSSYEIGIRDKNGKESFTLIQGPWTESQISAVGMACAILLDSGKFRPSDLSNEIFRQ